MYFKVLFLTPRMLFEGSILDSQSEDSTCEDFVLNESCQKCDKKWALAFIVFLLSYV